MVTNLAIGPELLERALAIGGEQTKKATVISALEEFIARRSQAKIVNNFYLFDEWDPGADIKAAHYRREDKRGEVD